MSEGRKKYIKVTVERKSKSLKNSSETRISRQGRTEVIKLAQKEEGKGTRTIDLWGCRRVNYADQKVKEAYQKVNRMLGGR